MPMPVSSDEQIALARRKYAAGEPVAQILRDTGMNVSTFYYWVDGGPASGPQHLPPLPRRRVAAAYERRPFRQNRKPLVARLMQAAEMQVRDIEARIAGQMQEPADRERDARTLAVLVRTIRELVAFEAERAPADEGEDDSGPRDIDEFRRELARRLEAIIARRRERTDRDPQLG